MAISIKELEQQLKQQKRAAIKLATRRDKLRAELTKVQSHLDLELIMVGLQDRPRKTQSGTSLRTKVFEILKNSPTGLSLEEIVRRVIAIGHLSKSQDFRTQVLRVLSASHQIILDDDRHVYQLVVS